MANTRREINPNTGHVIMDGDPDRDLDGTFPRGEPFPNRTTHLIVEGRPKKVVGPADALLVIDGIRSAMGRGDEGNLTSGTPDKRPRLRYPNGRVVVGSAALTEEEILEYLKQHDGSTYS